MTHVAGYARLLEHARRVMSPTGSIRLVRQNTRRRQHRLCRVRDAVNSHAIRRFGGRLRRQCDQILALFSLVLFDHLLIRHFCILGQLNQSFKILLLFKQEIINLLGHLLEIYYYNYESPLILHKQFLFKIHCKYYCLFIIFSLSLLFNFN